MNPNGTGPVLRDEGSEPVWETGTILRYLATRYGTDSFWPAFREHVMVSTKNCGPADSCKMPCSGNRAEICGGFWANSVYETFRQPASPESPQR
jgi:hypothetical protein